MKTNFNEKLFSKRIDLNSLCKISGGRLAAVENTNHTTNDTTGQDCSDNRTTTYNECGDKISVCYQHDN